MVWQPDEFPQPVQAEEPVGRNHQTVLTSLLALLYFTSPRAGFVLRFTLEAIPGLACYCLEREAAKEMESLVSGYQ